MFSCDSSRGRLHFLPLLLSDGVILCVVSPLYSFSIDFKRGNRLRPNTTQSRKKKKKSKEKEQVCRLQKVANQVSMYVVIAYLFINFILIHVAKVCFLNAPNQFN